uniref:Transmembrane protein n=2 Tax=Arion vulgaris TaxID=1028688 RepID=A0A0B7AYM0_9EUPU
MASKANLVPIILATSLMGAAYFFVGRPYFQKKETQKFESQAREIFQRRQKREAQGSMDDATYK